jgi:hypothetical protein
MYIDHYYLLIAFHFEQVCFFECVCMQVLFHLITVVQTDHYSFKTNKQSTAVFPGKQGKTDTPCKVSVPDLHRCIDPEEYLSQRYFLNTGLAASPTRYFSTPSVSAALYTLSDASKAATK